MDPVSSRFGLLANGGRVRINHVPQRWRRARGMAAAGAGRRRLRLGRLSGDPLRRLGLLAWGVGLMYARLHLHDSITLD